MSKITELLRKDPHKLIIELDNRSNDVLLTVKYGDLRIEAETSMPVVDIDVINQLSIMVTALTNKINGKPTAPQYYMEKS